jgi:hypothetical protein
MRNKNMAKKSTAKDLVIEDLTKRIANLENRLFLAKDKNKRLQDRLKPFLKKEKLEREEIIKKVKAENILREALEAKELAKKNKIKSIKNETRAIERKIKKADPKDKEALSAYYFLLQEKEEEIDKVEKEEIKVDAE